MVVVVMGHHPKLTTDQEMDTIEWECPSPKCNGWDWIGLDFQGIISSHHQNHQAGKMHVNGGINGVWGKVKGQAGVAGTCK